MRNLSPTMMAHLRTIPKHRFSPKYFASGRCLLLGRRELADAPEFRIDYYRGTFLRSCCSRFIRADDLLAK